VRLKALKISDMYAIDIDDEKDVEEFILRLSESSQEVLPSVLKNGIYNNGVMCWVEINKRAFVIPCKQFNYVLSEYEYRERPLTEKEFESICNIRKMNPKRFKKLGLGELYCKEIQRREIVDIKRSVYRAFL